MNDQPVQHRSRTNLYILLFSLPGFISLMLHGLGMITADFDIVGDRNGNHAVFTALPDGSPKAIFYTKEGEGVLSMQLTPTGVPILSMQSVDGSRALDISTATPTGAAMITLYDPATGAAAWSLTLDENGAPVLSD